MIAVSFFFFLAVLELVRQVDRATYGGWNLLFLLILLQLVVVGSYRHRQDHLHERDKEFGPSIGFFFCLSYLNVQDDCAFASSCACAGSKHSHFVAVQVGR